MARSTAPRSIRLPAHLTRRIALEARRTGRSFTAVVTELLEEAARTRQYRHIVFAGPPGRRRAAIAGTGVDVWEVARDFHAGERSRARLIKTYHWIPAEKLDEALAYADAHAEEIGERLDREASWDEAEVRRAMPWSAPRPLAR